MKQRLLTEKIEPGLSSPPQTGISVIAATHPLLTSHTDYELPAGLTLDQMLEVVQPSRMLRRHAHIFLDHNLIPVEKWAHTTPIEGQSVLIRVVPGRGALRAILTIAILVIGTVFGGPLGGLLGLSGTLGTAVGTALIAGGGSLLLNAIAPIRPTAGHEQERDSPNYFLDRARNAARPFSPIPVVLGKHRMVPPLGAASYTEIPEQRQGATMDKLGDEQYLRMLVIWGYGPLKISDMRIGETPIADFDDVQIETREGRAGEPPLTLYTEDVNEQALSIELTETGSWATRRTALEADEISVDLTLPRGLFRTDEQGKRQTLSVEFDLQYREVGTADWLRPPFVETRSPDPPMQDPVDPLMYIADPGTYGGRTTTSLHLESHTAETSSVTLTSNRAVPLRVGYSWRVPSQGQFDVRIRRTTLDRTSEREFDALYWTVLRSSTSRDPIAFGPPLARTVIVIRATDQLHGSIDDLNAIASSYALDWDGSAWVEAETSNQASLYRLVLQGPARATPAPDALVDLGGLRRWHEYCEANGFQYNSIRDFEGSVFDVLADIASTGMASPSYAGGKWGVAVDDGAQLPVQHFTPRNSDNFRAERHFEPAPEALRVGFKNRDEGWRNDERIVYRDGFDENNTEVFATIAAPGITDSDHVYKFGRRHLAQILLRREAWTFNVDYEYLVAVRGDRVKLSHDVLLIGQKSARIKTVILNVAGDATGIEIDEQVSMMVGTDYGVSIRTVGDAAVPAQVVTVAGEEITNLDFSAPIPSTTPILEGDLLAFGEFGLETVDGLLVAINPESELRGQLTVLPWSSPGVYDAEAGPIPPYQTGLTPLPGRRPLVIEAIRSDESALVLQGGILTPRIVVEVEPIPEVDIRIDCQIRAAGTDEPYYSAQVDSQTPEGIVISDVEEGSSYDIRLRWRAGLIRLGPWTEELNHTVIGQSTPPPELMGLALSSWSENTVLIRWNQIELADVRFGGQVKFRHSGVLANPTWEDAISIGEPIERENYAILPAKPGWYLARVFDASGRISTVVSVSADPPKLLEYTQLSAVMEDPDFLGVKTRTEVSNQSLVLSAGEINGTYEFESAVDLGSRQPVRVTSVLELSGTDLTNAHVEFRETDDDPGGAVPSWSDWRRLDADQAVARGFEFRLFLSRSQASESLRVTTLGAVIDEPVSGGITWRRAWAFGTDYNAQDAVAHLGTSWVCLQAHFSLPSNAPGTTLGQAYWDVLVEGGVDDRTPNAPGVALAAIGFSSEAFYLVLAGIELSSDLGEDSVDRTQIQVSEELSGHSVDSGWADPLQDILTARPPIAETILLAAYGEYHVSSRVRNGATRVWSEWSAPESVVTRQATPDSGLPSAAGLDLEQSGAGVELIIARPGANFRSIWGYDIQANSGTSALDALPLNRDYTTHVRSVQDSGQGTVTPGGRTLTVIGASPGWSINAWTGKILYIYTSINVATGEVGFPHGLSILSNTANTATVRVGNSFIADPSGSLNYFFLVADEWLRVPEDLFSSRTLITRTVETVNAETPLESHLQLILPAGSYVRTRPNNFHGKGPWSNVAQVGGIAQPSGVLTASSLSIQLGSSATLFWTTANAVSASIDQGVGALSPVPGGSVVVTPIVDTIYTMTVLGGVGSTPFETTVEITVGPATPVIESFSVAPTTIELGQSAILSWQSSNALSAEIDQGVGDVSVDGSETVTPDSAGTINYVLSVYPNLDKTGTPVTRSVSLTVVPCTLPVIDSFDADPSAIESGDSTTLSWETTGATSVSIDQGEGVQGVDGSTSVSPSSTRTYELSATNDCGTVRQSVTVMVGDTPAPDPVIDSLTNDTTIISGESVTLEWMSSNALSATLDGLDVSVDGSQSVSPTVETTYTLIVFENADGSGLSDSQSVTVTVAGPRVDSFSISDHSITEGESVEITWTTTGATTSVVLRETIGNQFIDSAPLSQDGDTTRSPTETTTYQIRVRNDVGVNGSALITVTVSPVDPDDPVIPSFTRTPASITLGESVTLEWESTNGVSASINQGVGSVALTGSETVTPTATGNITYVLTVEGAPGTTDATASVTVMVSPVDPDDPVIPSFTRTPASITLGESVTLEWESTNGVSASINQGVGSVALTGSETVTPTATGNITYVLTVEGAPGTTDATASVTVMVAAPPDPVINSFTRSPATIVIGASVTLTWASTNGLSARINQGVGGVGVDGSRTITPTSTGDIDYTLTVWRDAGENGPSVSQSVTVEVLTLPPVIDSFVADPPSITSGDSTTVRWMTSNALSLRLTNVDFPVDGSHVFSPTANITYFIRAYENDDHTGRSVLGSVTVTVVPPPVIDSFSASSTSIIEGESIILSWGTSLAAAVELGVSVGGGAYSYSSVSADGTSTRTPLTTVSYRLRATNSLVAVVQSTITVTVNPPIDDPVIDSFSPDDSILVVELGNSGSTTLRWTSSNALSARLDGSNVNVDGSQVIVISQTTSYTLVVYETIAYGGETDSSSLTVTVQNP